MTAAPARQGIPFRPDPSARDREYRASAMRGFTAIAQQNEMMRDAGDLARSQWSDDRLAIDIATKGAVVPSATTMSGAPI